MRIYIKTLTGESFELEVDPSDTIESMKHQILDITGVEPAYQRIIFAGKQLLEDKTVSEYNIRKESTLHVVFRMKGNGEITLSNNERIDGTISLNNLMERCLMEFDERWKTFKSDSSLSQELMDITSNSFSIENSEDSTITTFMINPNLSPLLEKLIQECLRCAEHCQIQMGQIPLCRLGLDQSAFHLVHRCIIPLLKLPQKEYEVNGIIFYDGEKPLFDQNSMSFSPETWKTQGKGRSLAMHQDNSEWTINLCLGGKFGSSSVEFENGTVYHHAVGRGEIHPGSLKHGVTPCDGERFNLLLFLTTPKDRN